jgi:putative membrane-bound dehydrogenase-like protein
MGVSAGFHFPAEPFLTPAHMVCCSLNSFVLRMWRRYVICTAAVLVAGWSMALGANSNYKPVDTQTTGQPHSALEAMRHVKLPDGFKLTLATAEPDVRQPIAIAYDDRGRLWVAESYSYNGSDFTEERHDRIVIFEDPDGDGVFESRKIFHDHLNRLTGLVIGFDGVWVTTAPTMSFIPDRNADDIPDSEPIVQLDGWTLKAEHNTVNGLCWGPDGWLYGRHGIKEPSRPGQPGIPMNQRREVSCSIWRFHPVSHKFEIVVEGSVNPWGLDWDERGQLFMGTSVVDHLWHVVPGAQFKRTLAARETPPYPHIYELMTAANDHSHSTLAKLNEDGPGGHSHSDAMIYLGDRWPAAYRGSVFMSNIHGRRLNRDQITRAGVGRPFVATHAPNFLQADDPWFRAVSLQYGPDGDVVMTDWVDNGECHDRDGVHRNSGRIYKISWGEPRKVPVDLAHASIEELVAMQSHANEWFVRHARRRLQERAVGGANLASAHAALRDMFAKSETAPLRLRALWALFCSGGAEQSWLTQLIEDRDENVRYWAVRLLVDTAPVGNDIAGTLVRHAATERSWLVSMALASILPALPEAQRWSLGAALVRNLQPTDDPNLPRLLWLGWQDAVHRNPEQSLKLAAELRVPVLVEWIARRLAEDARDRPNRVALLATALRNSRPNTAVTLLRGIADGLPQMAEPASREVGESIAPFFYHADPVVSRSALTAGARLQLGAALDRLRISLRDPGLTAAGLSEALGAVIPARPSWLADEFLALLTRGKFADQIIKALATCDDPRVAPAILDSFPRLNRSARTAAIDTLLARESSVRVLLDALAAGHLEKKDITQFQARQVSKLASPALRKRFEQVWGKVNVSSAELAAKMKKLRITMKPDFLALGDVAHGRQLFEQRCAACHALFGKGGTLAPDLTGSGRKEVDYLITNVVDPNAVIGADWQLAVVTLKDGRVVSGSIAQETDATVTFRTPDGPAAIERAQIKSLERMNNSMMPQGLLDDLSPDHIRDLFSYLMSDGGEKTAGR